jgi:signal transduction histidine kinase
MQEGGTRKKSKAQRAPPEYMITKDDGEMITRMVQDCLDEDFDHATHHKEKLQKELVEMGQFLKKFGEVEIASNNRIIEPSTPQTDERVEVEE